MTKFNDKINKLINAERQSKGIPPLEYRPYIQGGVNTRALELADYGGIIVNGVAHVRVNGQDFNTAFPYEIRDKVVGENTLLNSYTGNPYSFVSEKYLAKLCFEQWKKNPGHYENMMYPDYKGISTSIKLSKGDGKFSYFVANQNFTYEWREVVFMNTEVELKLKQYKERFGEPLTKTYTGSMSDDEIISSVNICLEKNLTYFETLMEKYGKWIRV